MLTISWPPPYSARVKWPPVHSGAVVWPPPYCARVTVDLGEDEIATVTGFEYLCSDGAGGFVQCFDSMGQQLFVGE